MYSDISVSTGDELQSKGFNSSYYVLTETELKFNPILLIKEAIFSFVSTRFIYKTRKAIHSETNFLYKYEHGIVSKISSNQDDTPLVLFCSNMFSCGYLINVKEVSVSTSIGVSSTGMFVDWGNGYLGCSIELGIYSGVYLETNGTYYEYKVNTGVILVAAAVVYVFYTGDSSLLQETLVEVGWSVN